MKQIEKFLVVVLILAVISIAVTFSWNALLVRLYGAAKYGEITVFSKLVAIILLISKGLVNIFVALWLFAAARKGEAAPWAWLVFGIFFGLLAVVLFYLMRIYDILKLKPTVDGNLAV